MPDFHIKTRPIKQKQSSICANVKNRMALIFTKAVVRTVILPIPSVIADITDNGSEIAALLIFEHQIKTVPASCRQDCLTAISTKFNRQIGIFG